MGDKSLHFTDISVHKALGIQREDGFKYSDLSSGVNLIYGSNGSGKSTTALVIQELLWPGNTDLKRPTVDGRFIIDKEIWSVRIESGHPDVSDIQGSGTTPELGPAGNRYRYMLALHEMINDKNTDFAKVITAESQGGFDLDSARSNLKFSETFRKDKSSISAGKQALENVEIAREVQQQISVDEMRLPELEKKREYFKETASLKEPLKQALKLKNVETSRSELEATLKSYPEGIALLQGGEPQALGKLAQEDRESQNKLAEANSEIKIAYEKIDQLNLSGELFQENLIPRIKGLQDDLLEIEKQIENHNRSLLSARTEEEIARNRIGSHIPDTQFDALNTVEITYLSSFARQSHKVDAAEAILDAQERSLPERTSEAVQGMRTEQIREGISSLKYWLETVKPLEPEKPTSRKPLFFASVLMVLLSITLAVVYNPFWIILLLPAILLLLSGRSKPSKSIEDDNDLRDIYVSNYRNTDLPDPEAWETKEVIDLLRSLVGLAELRIREDSLSLARHNLKRDRKTLEQEKTELEKQKYLVEAKLGFQINLENQWLPLLVQNINLWQKSSTTLTALSNEFDRLEAKQTKVRSLITQNLHAYGYDDIKSSSQTAKVIEDLSGKFSTYREMIQKINDADRINREIQKKLKRISDEELAVFSKLNLLPSQSSLIEDWSRQRPDYLESKRLLDQTDFIIKDCRKGLTKSGNFKLLKHSKFEIEELIRQIEIDSDKSDDLHAEITLIENSVKEALKGHDLSDAISRKDAALAVLENVREQNFKAIAGDVFLNLVQKVAIDRSRPEVFKRAREILTDFTSGHLKLLINDRSNPPEFLASVDGSTSRPLDMLSVGERVQVLIAVRTAFLEQNESVKLPLILDEALGTSDDQRAGLVIDAVIKIAESGRQVFYFTAQHDEIAKWEARLKQGNTEHKVLNLDEIRNLEKAAAFPLNIEPLPAISIPFPGKMNHEEYGKILQVPNINPRNTNLDVLHLWHIIQDNALLFRILNLHVHNWGQYRNLMEYSAKTLYDTEPAQKDKMYAAVKAIAAACEGWRIGRGRKVDRAALLDSGCITERFMEDVLALVLNSSGNAEAIIAALVNGAVHNWRKAATEKLNEFFENNGYTSTDSVLPPNQVRIRVLASVAGELEDGLIDSSLIDRIAGSLPE